ncbi:hypothetical protein DWB61_03245 [Ancylomarina euxinus]|uniref:Universal stress protein n=1 Tax=Ancylomarina euxinus TaxID=2283627 RepID=A0A425Y6R7_9BACT|nr:hypothetical protein [Ancylomarina euxinus]MCZ4693981.1 hypothetical protein [Ancylomarina euxinus]MUP14598.1 hypothetical protein [Ancylomarina euxinus]RRG24146.1 hypothetical protein DWB61_03245 [Ancylomarina euxinus]
MYAKNQHILLLVQKLNPNKKALNHALKIATIFKSKVLISNSPFSKNKIADEDLENYISDHDNASKIQLSITEDQPNKIIKQLNIIFMFIEIDVKNDFKFYLRNNIFSWILNAKIPTFLVGQKTSIKTEYSNIILPIDHKKESKEKMIWASYFGRFNNAVVQLIPATEKEEVFKKTIRNTLLFTKKMFSQFIFNYKIHKSEFSSKHIDEEAFKMATTNESDLVVLMTGKAQGVFFLRYNSKKIKHLINHYPNPILLINPMKDYYLPCDG